MTRLKKMLAIAAFITFGAVVVGSPAYAGSNAAILDSSTGGASGPSGDAGLLGVAAKMTTPVLETITPGAWCKSKELLTVERSKDGDRYQCQPEGDKQRWKCIEPGKQGCVTKIETPITIPSVKPQPSKSAASKAPVVTPSKPAKSPSRAPGVAQRGGYYDDDQLPVTGPKGGAIAAAVIGGSFVVLGILGIWITRRRREVFTA